MNESGRLTCSFLTTKVVFCLIPETQCFAYDGQDEMLVCSCNFITDKEIVDVVNSLLDEDCWQLIVPAKVYHAMQKRGRCCGCFPNVVDIIVRSTEEYHAARASEGDKVVVFMERLRAFREEQKSAIIERRQRLSQVA